MNNLTGFTELTFDEAFEIDGGSVWRTIGDVAVIVGTCACMCSGVGAPLAAAFAASAYLYGCNRPD